MFESAYSFFDTPLRYVCIFRREMKKWIFDDKKGPAFDHVLTPERVGDILVGHDGETDRFVFNNPSLSPNLALKLAKEDVDVGEGQPLRWHGYQLVTDAVRVEKFNPEEGDVLDFSGLPQEVSFSGHTPYAHGVWLGDLDDTISHYPLKIDLDGDPRTIEMGVFLAPTSFDLGARGYASPDGEIILTGDSLDMHKTMTSSMFIFA